MRSTSAFLFNEREVPSKTTVAKVELTIFGVNKRNDVTLNNRHNCVAGKFHLFYAVAASVQENVR